MKQAKISEIFLSYQGEGPYTGSRQLFIRFYGCNLNCGYCDTLLTSYKSFTKESLLGKILDFGDDYNELTLTGGEPLLHAAFMRDFLELFTRHRKYRVYLETNGTLPDGFRLVADYVDVVAMDFKLPSSDEGCPAHWVSHEKFVRFVADSELIVKAVITDTTTIDDIKRMGVILSGVKGDFSVVLQPVTPVRGFLKEADREMLHFFKEHIRLSTGREAVVLGQTHKCLGIK